MTAELEAMQNSVECSRRNATQQTTVQAAKVDAMGYRLEDMKDLLLQRELRMEVQMAKLSNPMRTLGAAAASHVVVQRLSKPQLSNQLHLRARWCLCAPLTHQYP